ncbi:hypothetical protein DVG78_29425 [Runella aurantiaca]|uniref:Uncharacterized protein n=1 Tax=Runella aurantiaca TaxID=2282308 RepID=A0A369I237_9BACT|nr:hypothetical protein DVG78_29425 [Runella aurantiaca]
MPVESLIGGIRFKIKDFSEVSESDSGATRPFTNKLEKKGLDMVSNRLIVSMFLFYIFDFPFLCFFLFVLI